MLAKLSDFIERLLISVREFLNGVDTTAWGILVLFSAMWLYVKEHNDAAMYFAGVASTLMGVPKIATPKEIK